MADVSQVKLPNGTTYNIKDATARSTFAQYRRLDDPYYDEIYVTDSQVGNLTVTGAARFLNTINGSISGNAATATNVAWTGVTSRPTKLSQFTNDITFPTSIATSTGTNQITLAFGGKYALTAGGTSYIFTMPGNPDSDTWRAIQVNGTQILGTATNTGALNLKAGTNVSLSNSSGTVTINSSYINTTYSLSASGESVILTGSDGSTSTHDLSGEFAKYTPYKGNLSTIISQGSPATEMKTYWESNTNVPINSVNTAYNTNGQECTFILSKGGSASYGSILKYGYGDLYMWILRRYNNAWKSTDWEKISAGYADSAGTATSATSATQDGSGNVISSTYLPLAGGTLTNADAVYFTATNTTKINANSVSILQSPIPKYLWHDLFGFNRYGTPTYYVTADGSAWTEATLDKSHFAELENIGENVIKAEGQCGARWVWAHNSFAYSGGAWLVIGVGYVNPSATVTITFESSTDNSAWTLRHQSTHSSNSAPIWCKIDGYGSSKYLRLTITKDPSDTTKTFNVGSIRLLTARWGSQGGGVEFEYPYSWDADRTISTLHLRPTSNDVYDLGTTSLKWANAYATTFHGALDGNATSSTSASYLSAFRATIASANDLNALKGDGIKYANVQGNIASNYGDGLVVAISWSGSANYAHQLYFDDSSYVCGHRALNNGTWSDWKRFIDEVNYTDYTVTKTGTGASGTWGINISGNATTATKANSVATEVGSSAGARPVFYSWLGDTTKLVYDNNFNYNPSGGILTTTKFVGALQGNADSATLLNQDTTYKEGTAYVCQTSAGTVKAFCSRANNSNIGVSTNNYGCMLLSATWGGGTSYNGELFMGMGDFPNLYFRGKNNGTYTAWNAIGQFTATPTSGQVVIADGTTGGMKSSGYTVASNVPSGAIFTDSNVSQSATTTSNWRKIVLGYQDGSAGAAVTTYTNVVYVTPNAEIQPSTGTIRTAGNLQVSGTVCANVANQSTAGGLSLYSTDPQTYGVIFRGTGNQGKHGYVQSDWATYFTMSNTNNRGWVFRRQSSGNVASIDTSGQMVLNGSLTLGGNEANTSGVRQVYNATTQSLDFVFVA